MDELWRQTDPIACPLGDRLDGNVPGAILDFPLPDPTNTTIGDGVARPVSRRHGDYWLESEQRRLVSRLLLHPQDPGPA